MLSAVSVGAMAPIAEVVQLSTSDRALGAPETDDTGAALFKNPIRITGEFRIDRDDVEFCHGACVSFVPDAKSQKRLPRWTAKEAKEAGQILAIERYAARPILTKAASAKIGGEFLSPALTVYRAPATVTSKNFPVHAACGGIRYEASVVDLSFDSSVAQRGGNPESAGC